MVAVAEAAALAGVERLEDASATKMAEAWDIVSQAAGLKPTELAEGIAEQHRLEVGDVRSADARAAKLVPNAVAWRRNVMPLRYSERELVVATANPLSIDTKRELARTSGRTVEFEVVPPREISAAIIKTYGAPDPEGLSRPLAADEPAGPHVLVVDDEPGARTLYRSILQGGGFRVSVARDGPEALEMLAGDPTVDLVTLDYWMDKMNGLRVLQQIHAQPALANMPVIMVTGADHRDIAMTLFEAGADDYIAKPVDPPLFVLRVRAVLRRRRLEGRADGKGAKNS
jgi:CheY-like chemotaxis protein